MNNIEVKTNMKIYIVNYRKKLFIIYEIDYILISVKILLREFIKGKIRIINEQIFLLMEYFFQWN